MKALIIDDESLARDLIKKFLAGYPEIEIADECENGFEALKAIHKTRPDLIFLDIQMPKIDGFELLELLDEKPEIIFTTAFDQYAIRAFEMNAVDYLLKPFSKERLIQAVEKVRARLANAAVNATPNLEKLTEQIENSRKTLDRIVTRSGSKIVLIPVDQIHYLEAQDDYVMVHSALGRHLKEQTMKYFVEHLPADFFIRIHRSYLVNMQFITSVELYSKNSHLVTLKSGEKLKSSAEGYKRLKEIF